MKSTRLTDKLWVGTSFLKWNTLAYMKSELSIAENINLSLSTVFLFLIHIWMDEVFENITSM